MQLMSLASLLGLVLILPLKGFAGVAPVAYYAGHCTMFLANGNPVLEIYLYEKESDAQARFVSIVKPTTSVVVDRGAGYQVAKLYSDSKVKQICKTLAQKRGVQVVIDTTVENYLKSIIIDGNRINSDAYILMAPDQQAMIESLVRAYLGESAKVDKYEHPSRQP
jgi:hypothetical protein